MKIHDNNDLARICLPIVYINIYELLLNGYFNIFLHQDKAVAIDLNNKYFVCLRVFCSFLKNVSRSPSAIFPTFKGIANSRTWRARRKRQQKRKAISSKPTSRRSRMCTLYGRQYNATIMIRIKFTQCASRNGAAPVADVVARSVSALKAIWAVTHLGARASVRNACVYVRT